MGLAPWVFDFTTQTWTLKSPTPNRFAQEKLIAAYDTYQGEIITYDGVGLQAYNVEGDTWRTINETGTKAPARLGAAGCYTSPGAETSGLIAMLGNSV